MEAQEAQRLVDRVGAIVVILLLSASILGVLLLSQLYRIADALERAYPPKTAVEKP